jgi:hypothetical protein
VAAWVSLQVLTAAGVALRLRSAVQGSPAADGWGEGLTAQGLWEIMERGGLGGDVLGPWTAAAGLAAILWAIWAGWKVQAKAAGVAAGPAPLLLSVPVALCIGCPPLWALHASIGGALGFAAGSGIQFLGWADFIGSPLLRMCFASSLAVQWWLCRMDMARRAPEGARGWLRHAKDGFLRLWSHPVQWGVIVFFGAAARAGLSLAALALAWRWGGEPPWLWGAMAVQALAAAANAWAIGWALRATALYWKSDAAER